MPTNPVRVVSCTDEDGTSDPVRIANCTDFLNSIVSGAVKRGVFAYLTAPATTTVVAAGTYYPISGNFDNDPVESFQFVADPAIQYVDTLKLSFEIDIHATLSGNSNGVTANIGIKKNGVLETSSVMGSFLKISNEAQAVSCTCVVELQENDKIQLVVTADGDGDQITFDNFTTTIRPFF